MAKQQQSPFEHLRPVVEYHVGKTSPGLYELPELLAAIWSRLDDKTRVGRWFKAEVDLGHFAGVSSYGKTNENHQVYLIS